VLSSFFLDGMEKLLSLTGQPECPDIPMFTLPSSSIKFGRQRVTNLQFFSILTFLIIILKMNPMKHFFFQIWPF
jgi:hypothetical protein